VEGEENVEREVREVMEIKIKTKWRPIIKDKKR